ncbi:hypothetical protein ACJMK2_016803 [Sinanodonta woodiana]|uniref:Uncharacterized protein n=1 Tax=Sinanodonta woodiana TaxID=1069815 RepID=A0ABD3UUV7_SINWO
MFQEKQKQSQVKLQRKLDQPDGEKNKGTEKMIISLQKKFTMYGELIEQVCLSYQTVLKKEIYIRREIQQLAEDLQQQIAAITRDKLAESLDLLDEMTWSKQAIHVIR